MNLRLGNSACRSIDLAESLDASSAAVPESHGAWAYDNSLEQANDCDRKALFVQTWDGTAASLGRYCYDFHLDGSARAPKKNRANRSKGTVRKVVKEVTKHIFDEADVLLGVFCGERGQPLKESLRESLSDRDPAGALRQESAFLTTDRLPSASQLTEKATASRDDQRLSDESSNRGDAAEVCSPTDTATERVDVDAAMRAQADTAEASVASPNGSQQSALPSPIAFPHAARSGAFSRLPTAISNLLRTGARGDIITEYLAATQDQRDAPCFVHAYQKQRRCLPFCRSAFLKACVSDAGTGRLILSPGSKEWREWSLALADGALASKVSTDRETNDLRMSWDNKRILQEWSSALPTKGRCVPEAVTRMLLHTTSYLPSLLLKALEGPTRHRQPWKAVRALRLSEGQSIDGLEVGSPIRQGDFSSTTAVDMQEAT